MKILLRSYNVQKYVWKTAAWKNGYYYLCSDDGETLGPQVNMTAIIAVKEDNRAGFVFCNHCGQLIENTPESIERHFAEEEAKKDCLKCQYLTTYGDKYDRKATYTPNADGTYAVSETYDSFLGCKVGYYTQEINSSKAKAQCIYGKCRRSGVSQIKDVFVQYPDVFDKHITVDALIEKKYPCDGFIDGYFHYDLKCRGTIKALVNELGIVERFSVDYRGARWYCHYSARYNKIFFEEWNRYSDKWDEYVTRPKYDQLLEKLSKLYEEANANE